MQERATRHHRQEVRWPHDQKSGIRVFYNFVFISLFIYLYVGKKGKKVRTGPINPVPMLVPGFQIFLPCSYLFLQGKNFWGCWRPLQGNHGAQRSIGIAIAKKICPDTGFPQSGVWVFVSQLWIAWRYAFRYEKLLAILIKSYFVKIKRFINYFILKGCQGRVQFDTFGRINVNQ